MSVEARCDSRWRRITEVFFAAIDRPPEAREAFLAEACSGDDDLRRRVGKLLAADARDDGVLDRSAGEDLLAGLTGPEASASDRIGPYRLLRRLGPSGLATVWLAVRDDREHHRHVALKVFHRALATEDQRRRWAMEQQILASLEHPHIARLYDAGTTGEGSAYLVLEYVAGEAITEYCDRHCLTVDERIDLFSKLCDAVAYAHRNLVLHRDLKPSNVLVTEEGVPKLLDFGIARVLNPDLVGGGSPPTVPWQQLLTPAYASPEQLAGQPLTTATDIYSLGVLLYELLAGRRPFALAGLSPAAMERRLAGEEPEPPSAAVARTGEDLPPPEAVARERGVRPEQLRRTLAGDLDAIVATALANEPRRRYAGALELARDLERHRTGLPVTARSPTLAYRLGRAVRRHRAAMVTAATVGVLTVAAAVVLAVLSLRLVDERDRAARERDRAQQALAFIEQIFEASDPDALGPSELSVGRLLEAGERLAEQRFAGQPEALAELKTTIGRLYRRHGLPERAEPLLREALALRRTRPDGRTTLDAEALDELGRVQIQLGRLEAAEASLREALALRVEALGGDHPQTAETRLNLAAVLDARGLYQEAEELAQAALAVARAHPQTEPRLLAVGLDRLAGVLSHRGAHERAVSVYRQALSACRSAYGEESVETADALNNLAIALKDQDSVAEAADLLRQALELNRRLRRDQHLNLLANLNNLASLAIRVEDFEEARRLYSEALAIATPKLGADHPNLSFLLLGLGRSLTALGRPAEAEEPLRRALEIRRRTFPAGHFMTATAEALLGACLTDLGRFEEAEALLLASHRVVAAQDPPRERELDRVRSYLVALYQAWGQPAAAERYRTTGGEADPAPVG